MSKKFFAKYIPVKGDINDGDICFDLQESKYMIRTRDDEFKRPRFQEVESKLTRIRPLQKMEKRELSLCSKDIEVGDKVIFRGKEYEVTKDSLPTVLSSKNMFKVIGKVSPEATWVKSGDEFDEDVLVWQARNEDGDVVDIIDWGSIDLGSLDKDEEEFYTVGIKGPCGHFH